MKQIKKVLIVVFALVVSMSMMSATNVNAATNSQKKNFNKVVKALKNNGDHAGKWWTIEDSSHQYLVSTNGKKIKFSYISNDEDIVSVCDISISKNNLKKMKVESLSYLNSDSNDFTFFEIKQKTFAVKKYNYKNYNYKYKFNDKGYLGSYNAPDYSYLACKEINKTMKKCNSILKRNTGYSLKTLGFKKCK